MILALCLLVAIIHIITDDQTQTLDSPLQALSNKHPQPFTNSGSPSDYVWDALEIHGVTFEYAARHESHKEIVRNHVRREINGYAILKDAIQNAGKDALVLDIGANHALYSLFAAKLGAHVITVEPQESLCRAILAAAKKNGIEDGITLYHNAVLEQYEVITMKNAEKSDGGLATVVREGGKGGDNIKVEAFPISQFVSPDDTRRIAFLKIDVEGFDLHAMESAKGLFSRVDNALVEFGPPSRWKETAGDDKQMGLGMLKDLHAKFGLEPRIIQGYPVWGKNVWPSFIAEMKKTNEAGAAISEKAKMHSFPSDRDKALFLDSMEATNEESFLWLVPENGRDAYPVFRSDCSSHNKEGIQTTGSDGSQVLSFGCNKNDVI